MRLPSIPAGVRLWAGMVFLAASSALAQVPTITSAPTDTGQVGQSFSYSITTDVAALGYTALGLPDGLFRNFDEISGVPQEAGVFDVTLTAFNAAGAGGPFTLTLTINNSDGTPPTSAITSPLTDSAYVSATSYSYQITATGTPLDYNAFGIDAGSDLPNLSIDTATGIISGNLPSTPGSYDIALVANYVGGGTASATLTLTINPIPVPTVNITTPTGDQIIGTGESLTFATTATTAFGTITQVELWANGNSVLTDDTAPYEFTYTFANTGTYDMTVVATNSFNQTTTAPQTISVTVEGYNPLVRDEDFVIQLYEDLFNTVVLPDSTKVVNGVAFLEAGNTRGELVAALMSETIDQLDYTATLNIFRTMTGYWPDYTTLQNQVAVYGGVPATYAQSITLNDAFFATKSVDPSAINPQNPSAVDTLENNPDWIAELRFINGLYENKYGVSAMPLYNFSVNVLALALYNKSLGNSNDYGTMVADFAMTNDISGLISGAGYFLSIALPYTASSGSTAAQYGYEIPSTKFNAKVQVAQLIAGLLRRQPTDAEVNGMVAGRFNLATTAQAIFDGAEYQSRFPPAYTLDLVANGSGTVSVNPEQINPDNAAQFLYNEGSTIRLTATPDAGFAFSVWDINGTVVGENPYDLLLLEDTVATATFAFASADDLVALAMAEDGVTDPAAIDPAVDFDGDDSSNLAEVIFGSNATDVDSRPVLATTPDGDSGFLVELVLLEEQRWPSNLTVFIECSADMVTWVEVPANQVTTLGVSQAGVPEDYERVRVSVDFADCNFVRGRVTVD